MFYFERKIYYIDYFENGEKRGNGGFISLTFKEDECLVHVGIRNIPYRSTLTCRWFGLKDSKRHFLEEIKVVEGKADFVQCYKKDRLGRKEVDIEDLDGFYFSLGNKRWGSCFAENIKPGLKAPPREERVELQASEKNALEKKESVTNSPDSVIEKLTKQNAKRGKEMQENAPSKEPETAQDNQENNQQEGEGWTDFSKEEEESVGRTSWDELIKTHQMIHPFDDQGDYISINPFTLKLLAPKYRKLSNNSFLLHGFYNYRHIILGYYRDSKREGYYIGVPGTFHEKEQLVAEMFGFEGYESSGDLGYYMRKVEF